MNDSIQKDAKLLYNELLAEGINVDSDPEKVKQMLELALYRASLDSYIDSHREWIKETFGVTKLQPGLIKHINNEIAEIETAPSDVSEWVDLCILALQGLHLSMRYMPASAVREAIWAKHEHNMYDREWNITGDPEKPIEHIREEMKPPGGDAWKHMGVTNIRTMELRPEDRLCNGQDCEVNHRLKIDGTKYCIKCGIVWDHYGGRIA